MARDGQSYVFIFIILFIDIASSLLLSHESMTKNVDETFVVICRDELGESVVWKGPNGTLNSKTHPRVGYGRYGTSIYFNRTRREDSGNYTCISTRSQNDIKVFSLKIEDIASSLLLSHESMTKNVDETFMVICRDELGESVVWKGPNGTLNSKTRPRVEYASYGTAIYFNRTRKVDSGNYTCISTRSQNDIKVFSLKIEEVLAFVDCPKIQTGKEGRPFHLKCKVNLAKAQIRWSVANGQHLGSHFKQLHDGLYFPNLTRKDAQVYQCMAVHPELGTMISQDITIIVQHKPTLPFNVFAGEKKEKVYAFLNEAVNLTCEVEANPAPKFKWHHKGKGKVIKVSDFRSVLELNVTQGTPGTYQCIASNQIGALKKYFEVLLEEHPESPTNIELVEASSDSLELRVELVDIPLEIRDPVMDPQWIVVDYKPVSEDEWYSEEFNITSDSIVLSGLSKETMYEIRAATKNDAGLSAYFFNNTIFETSPAVSVHTITPIGKYLSVLLIPMFWIA